MVILFVEPQTDSQRYKRIKQTQKMILKRRDIPIQYDDPEIMNIDIDRIAQEDPLNISLERINLIENGTHVIEQDQENIIKISYIPEKHKQCT